MSYISPKGEILSAASYSFLTFEQKSGFKASQENPTHQAKEGGGITELVEEEAGMEPAAEGEE